MLSIEYKSNTPIKINFLALKIYAEALYKAQDIAQIEQAYSLCCYELNQIYRKVKS